MKINMINLTIQCLDMNGGKIMQIGCLARYFNPYKEEVEFAQTNN